MKKLTMILVSSLLGIVCLTPGSARAGKDEKEAIQKLTSEVIILQRQIRDMQESVDRSNGQLIALISQISDKVAATSVAIQDVQARLQDTQTRVSTSLATMDTRMLAFDSSFRVVNERLSQTLDQLSAMNQGLTALKTATGSSLDLTDPVLVFGAAYGDFLKGNYQLSIDQFRQFLMKFPDSDQADDAQYWIGEALLNQGLNEPAIDEFESLISRYPGADKVPAARLKMGLALVAVGQSDVGIEQLRGVVKDYADSAEAEAAKQRLEELGVPLTEPTKPQRGRRTRKS